MAEQTVLRIFYMVSAALVVCLCVGLGLAALYTFWQARKIDARFPPAGQMLDAGGTSIHFTDLRPKSQNKSGAEKQTILLIHGASGNEADMRLALASSLLALNYRVVSIDRPGLGWSGRPANPDDDNLAGQARLIRRVMSRHGVRNALVVVHSLAGAIGLQLALDHPDFTKALLMISPATHPWPGGIARYYTVAASMPGQLFNYTLALPLGQAMMKPAVQSVFAPQNPPNDYVKNTKLPLVLRPQTFGANAGDVAGLYNFVTAQAPRYKNIRTPVAIISGSADTIVLTEIHSRNSARDIPGATLTILPGAGHAPHWSHTADVVAEIGKLHARLAASPRPAQAGAPHQTLSGK
jgi:pimeloyl-ACP methyl ester carboxylesterase